MRALEGMREVSTLLKEYGVEDFRKEAELIVSDFVGIEKVALYRDDPPLSSDQEMKISEVLERRRGREPIQYVIGSVDFCGFKIRVGPGVLVPRPETELIVEEAIKTVESLRPKIPGESLQDSGLPIADRELRILDLCTGSGCLALALAGEFPNSRVFGTDISGIALEYATSNAEMNEITNTTFREGDLFEPFCGLRFDLIVSNPPYVRRSEIGHLAPEVRTWEPVTALDGGDDGLQFYRRILSQVLDYLSNEGSLIIELGQGQAASVLKIAEDAGLRMISLTRDYAGIERVMHLKAV